MAPDLRQGLSPALLAKLDIVLDRMAKAGAPMRICQGLRTAEYQHELWLKGRDAAHPGKPVTNCDGYKSKSNHQAHDDGFGWAADCCFLGSDPWAAKQPALWKQFGELAKAQGLVWGGDFKLVDLDHVEMPRVPAAPHA